MQQHQESEARKKGKEPINIISIPIMGGRKTKYIPLLMLNNKHSHNRMLFEEIILKGESSTLFENKVPDATFTERVAEGVYKEFYKHKYNWFSFMFEEGSNMIQF